MTNEVMIVAGEASGDLHGSRLIGSMLNTNPELHFCGIGGPELEKCGVELLYDASKIAVVGVVEVVSHLSHILRAQRILRRRLAESRPRLLILIDFPDFNLLLARKAKKLGVPIYYYISPQVWAWRSGRVKTLGSLTDGIGVILPFEEQFYRKRGVDKAHYVGHPLVDTVRSSMTRKEFCLANDLEEKRKLIGILPGSRRREVRHLLPEFLAAAESFQQNSEGKPVFLVAQAPTIETEELLHSGISEYRSRLDIHIYHTDRYELIGACDAVIAASGTATLEILLLGTPMVVAYKLSPLTYRVGKLLVKIDYFSLVNLIAGEEIVTELLQEQAHAEKIAEELHQLIYDEPRRNEQLAGYDRVREKLGGGGASERAAAFALSLMADDG